MTLAVGRLLLAIPLTLPLLLATSCAVQPKVHYASATSTAPFSSMVRTGNTYYVAGHLGRDADGNVPTDPKVEAELMLDAIAKTMARGGLTLSDLVSVQVFCSDVSLYAAFNEVYSSRLSAPFPARAFIGSGPLLFGARFEMNGIAFRR